MTVSTFRQSALKTGIGLTLIALSFLVYVIFQSAKTDYLIPLGVASFVAGFYLALDKVKAFQSIKKVLTFIVIGILIFWIFFTQGWDKDLLDSTYAMMFADVATNFTILSLNFFGIQATQDGNSIIFPPDSKIPQVDVTPACAGFQSSVIFLAAFDLMVIDLGRKASKKKLAVIFAIGIASVFFANMVRIAFLAYVAYAFGSDVLETDHMYAGTIMFLLLIGLFWWLSLRWILKKPKEQVNYQ